MLCYSPLLSIYSCRHNSPVWLVTDNEALGREVMALIPQCIASLPELNRINATAAWRDYGEVILCKDRDEMLQVANEMAPEHLHVSASGLDWWRDNLTCYGSLFLGRLYVSVSLYECMLSPCPVNVCMYAIIGR